METLGWIIWGFGYLLLVITLSRLGKKKGRARRIFFCSYAAAGLALTYYTSLAKFHLLWILMLRFLPALSFFALAVPAALGYHKITRRRPKLKILPPQSYPPFGELKWDNDNWEGQILLPAWAGFQSRGGPYGSQDSGSPADGLVTVNVNPADGAAELTPSDAQCRAMKFQIEHGEEVVQSVLTALLPHYKELKKEWESCGGKMPAVVASADFKKMMGLSQVHVLPDVSDDLAYVGMEFGCEWDDEHGLGVVLHGSRVVDVGQADTAFCWQPDETPPAPLPPK